MGGNATLFHPVEFEHQFTKEVFNPAAAQLTLAELFDEVGDIATLNLIARERM